MHISEWDGAIGGRGKEKARRSTNIQNWHENGQFSELVFFDERRVSAGLSAPSV